MMPGRRWSDGLHQAVEAKEGIRIREESQTLATITFQNYFRLYHKIAGMTGTAITEAAEFAKIYDLEVVQIPTNRPNQRDDYNDVIYPLRGVRSSRPSWTSWCKMRDRGAPGAGGHGEHREVRAAVSTTCNDPAEHDPGPGPVARPTRMREVAKDKEDRTRR